MAAMVVQNSIYANLLTDPEAEQAEARLASMADARRPHVPARPVALSGLIRSSRDFPASCRTRACESVRV